MSTLMQLSGVIIDFVYRIDAVPSAGTEAVVRDLKVDAGGGYNAMVAARRSGMQVIYAGAHGTGPLGELARQALARESITVALPRNDTQDQGCCTTLVDRQGERTFIAKEGAEGSLSAEDLEPLDPDAADCLLLSGYSLVYEGCRDALGRHVLALPGRIPLVFDPCPLVARIPAAILAGCMAKAHWISANAVEAAFLSGVSGNPIEAAKLLAAERPAGVGGAVVRLGAEGCIVATRDSGAVHCQGFAVESIDTNGAGDVHIGAFIAQLAAGMTPVQSAIHANACAALSTTQAGPATAPLPGDVASFLAARKQ